MAFLFPVLFITVSLLSAFPPSCESYGHGSCIESERTALLSIKAGLFQDDDDDNNNNNRSWLSSWTGRDCCRWRGVVCNQDSGHVIKLDLQYPYTNDYDMPPASKLNSSLLHLPHLKHLDLSMNNFDDSPIPDFIGSLANLEYLNLSNAIFSGAIPHTLGSLSRLRFLDLQLQPYQFAPLFSDNLHWLSGLTSLQHLDLSCVNLSKVTGWLHDINMLPSLRVLKLSEAKLQGGIHATTLVHLNFTSLVILDLSQNNLKTTLPQWLFKLSSLVHLDLSSCDLYGELPATIGNLGSLERLELSDNKLNGSIPETLNNLTKLVSLDLSFNDIIGKLPKRIGRLQKLEKLNLAQNQVQGWIPESIGGLRNLQYLNLSGNMISGEIPESFGNLTLLQYFDASRGNNLSSKFPETIGNLVHLQFLDLSQNAISGRLPECFGNFSQLQHLIMPGNGITGLPETAGRLYSLQELDLSKNNIVGALPKHMGNSCKLQRLDLTSNFISGAIDDLLNGLSKCTENKNGSISESMDGLTTLRLGNNKLNGTVPESIGQLSKLNTLHLSSNSLVGFLTESHFVNLANLEYVDFSYNLLQLNVSEDWSPPFNAITIRMCSCRVGPIFPSWVKTQTNLGDLCLSDAGISGNIPAWFWNLSSTPQYFLNLSNNNLEGRLPTSSNNYIFSLIDLSSNRFDGPIPKFDPIALFVIDLTNNSFSGSIPSYFIAATHIQVFSLSDNHINGSIPSFFCNLTSLALLDLSNNNMSGGLPQCWNSTSALEILDLSSNNFIGKIPQGLVSLTKLRSLHLRNNKFSGDLPLSLKNANKLVTLDIGENKLSGSIPTWLGENLSSLIILRLRSNFFEGVIPEQLSKLSSLQILDLAHNKLSGCIPHSFGDFKAMVTSHNEWRSLFSVSSQVFTLYELWGSSPSSFDYPESLLISAKGLQMEYTKVLSLVTSIDLSSNQLSCELPEELTKLFELHFLNVSDNLFSGKIPGKIGDMKQLESLDLSSNNLSGIIPSSMSTLNFLNHLNLSDNSLSGKIPPGGQLQTFPSSAYNWNHNLCGFPLQSCASETPSRGAIKEEGNGDTSEMIWLYIGLALGFISGFWVFIGTIITKQTIRIAYFRTIDMTCDWIYVKMAIYSRRLKSTMSRSN